MYAKKGILVQCSGKEKIEAMIADFIKKFNQASNLVDYNFFL